MQKRAILIGTSVTAAIVTVAGVALIRSGGGDSKSAATTVSIDPSVTKTSPKIFEQSGLKATFYYVTTDLGGGGHERPYVSVDIANTQFDEPTWTFGPERSIRATVQVRQNGVPVDVYFTGKEGRATNEMIANGVSGQSMFGLHPYVVGTDAYLSSETGRDFEFILSDFEVRPTPFAPRVTATTAPPKFGSSPADQFNKLAYEKGWTPPDGFGTKTSSSGTQADQVRQPAAAIQSFIRQVNGYQTSATACCSPTQIFLDWSKKWNAEMLSAGISMLGDDQIKETYRRVQASDIEYWYGSGTLTVGDGPNQIRPGTYKTTAPVGKLIQNGYWERTSRSGDIIDNSFVTSAQEVTVTIAPSDGQFTSRGMGAWKPVG
ncbi:hypothetical protein ACFXG4_04915 [Nocardia sp. NPDC059246]|uniref:hypothetical protein n=1 Tax=unclassified Nocardia TaxID=2637762 RepID=UPI0036B6F85F